MNSSSLNPRLGVVVVTFNADDVILDCLESLLAATGVTLEIIVVDNASTDGTVAQLRDWAAGTTPYAPPADLPFALQPAAKPITLHAGPRQGGTTGSRITLIETGVNGGFAAGVNIGLASLAACRDIDRFWVFEPGQCSAARHPFGLCDRSWSGDRLFPDGRAGDLL